MDLGVDVVGVKQRAEHQLVGVLDADLPARHLLRSVDRLGSRAHDAEGVLLIGRADDLRRQAVEHRRCRELGRRRPDPDLARVEPRLDTGACRTAGDEIAYGRTRPPL